MSSETAAFDSARKVDKRCRVCGKDLNGHRRIRDGDAYICPVCDQLEREGQAPDGVPCAECGRKLHPGALRKWGDIKLCPRCHTEHQEQPSKKVRKVDGRAWDDVQRQQIVIYGAVAGVLLLFMILGWLLS